MKPPPRDEELGHTARLDEIGAILDQLHVIDTEELPRDYSVQVKGQSAGVFIRSGKGSNVLNWASRFLIVIILCVVGGGVWGVRKAVGLVGHKAVATPEGVKITYETTCPLVGVARGQVSGYLPDLLSTTTPIATRGAWRAERHGSDVWRVQDLPEGTVTQMIEGGSVAAVSLALRQSTELCVALAATGLLQGKGRHVRVSAEGQVSGDVVSHTIRAVSSDQGAHVKLVQVEP